MVRINSGRRNFVQINVDENFFNQFEDKRNAAAKKIGVKNISQIDFTKMMAKKNIVKDAELFNDEKTFKRQKRNSS